MMVDITCCVAAAFFIVSNLFKILGEVTFRKRSHFNYQSMKELDPAYIQEEWEFRSDHRGSVLLVGGLNALAWLCFTIPVLQLSWILSRGGRRKIGIHITMAVLVLAGSFSEFLAWMFAVGTFSVSDWISRDFNLDNWLGGDENDMVGWRVLEVSHLVLRGLHMWIDAFEWLAMFGILVLVHISIKTQTSCHAFKLRWTRIGLAIAGLSILDFAADVLRLQSWRFFSTFANFTSALNTLVLLPIWLITLGRQLPAAVPNYVETEEDEFVNKVESAQEAQEILEDIV
mmetsp:Transcript_27883/g.39230  ORF Transcript_27883/g.39230 Transcript_27883/m.39230 type:complete len:286 (-) Transcript_27883:8-865(-)